MIETFIIQIIIVVCFMYGIAQGQNKLKNSKERFSSKSIFDFLLNGSSKNE